MDKKDDDDDDEEEEDEFFPKMRLRNEMQFM